MSFSVQSRRASVEKIREKLPNAAVFDVTSKGPAPWVKFSPFYPHGDIPVPFSGSTTAASVEGIWQGLKVFESVGMDRSKLKVTSMSGIKRSTRSFGPIRGHQKGLIQSELLSYRDARFLLYLPCYRWVLENKLGAELAQLRALGATTDVVLLDYETNCDVENLKKPLSHAGLVVAYLEDRWPVFASAAHS